MWPTLVSFTVRPWFLYRLSRSVKIRFQRVFQGKGFKERGVGRILTGILKVFPYDVQDSNVSVQLLFVAVVCLLSLIKLLPSGAVFLLKTAFEPRPHD